MSLHCLLDWQCGWVLAVGFRTSRGVKWFLPGNNYLLVKSGYNEMPLYPLAAKEDMGWQWFEVWRWCMMMNMRLLIELHIESSTKPMSDFSEKVWKWITLSDSVDVTRRISTFSHQWVVIRWGLAEPLIDAASQTRELHSPDNIFWLLSTPPLGSEETKKSGSLRSTLTNDPQPLGLSSPKMICTEDVIVSNSAFSFAKHFCLHGSVE